MLKKRSYSQRDIVSFINGLLRQYFPKKPDFKKVTQYEVKRAVERLNARPRKQLGFKTPSDLMAEHRATLAA